MIKFFRYIFIFIFLLSLQVNASNSISDDEVIDLITRAVELFDVVYYDASKYIDEKGESVIIDRNGRMVNYLPAKEEFYNYNVWEDFAKSIYSENIYSYALEHGKGSGHTLGTLINHEEKAYFLSDSYLGWQPFFISDLANLEVGEKDSSFWLERNDNGLAKGYLRLNNNSTKEQGAPVPLTLSVHFAKTDNGWRISGGSLVDLFCPMHEGERHEKPNGYFKYYPLLYPQVAEKEIVEAMQIHYEKAIVLNSLKIIESGYKYAVSFDGEGKVVFDDKGTYIAKVEISSNDIFENVPFELTLTSSSLDENWKVDISSIKNPRTSDDSEGLFFILVFAFLGLKLWHFTFKRTVSKNCF